MNVNKEMSTYIHLSKYSRWIEEEGRRETWDETVDRLHEFWQGRLDSAGIDAGAVDISTAIEAVKNLEVMPSMRSLMTAGKALERDNVAGFNCFSGDTKFLTSVGYKRFSDFVDGETTKVLTKDGTFREAMVRSFGKQRLQQVTLRPNRGPSNIRRIFKVTKDHRWITGRGETTSLQVGDSIPFIGRVPNETELSKEYFLRGLLFGDGTIDQRGRARIRLCGTKSKYLHLFEEFGNCSIMNPPSFHKDPLVVLHTGVLTGCKRLPIHCRDLDALSAWLLGYLSADSCDEKGSVVLSSQSQEAVEFVEKIAPICGLAVTGKSASTVLETNFGRRRSPLMKITLREGTKFYVTNIEDLYEDEVFCVVEPVTKTFTLEHGVLTGNCAAIAVNHPRVFDEIFYLLMCGCGVGFSVERQYTNRLPEVSEDIHETETTIKVRDSKIGWAKGLKELIAFLYNGDIPLWDLSSIRPAGSRLRTFGGRASGPEPLDALFRYVVRLFSKAAGRRLNSIECHDLICKIADTVIVGSVRRSACISLSNLTDDRMRRAKTGDFGSTNPERYLANNSVAYTEKPDLVSYLKEFRNLYVSKSGERGVINKEALRDKAEDCGREHEGDYLLNPCFHGDTLVETVEGQIPIKNITEPTYVYSMDASGKLVVKKASASFITKKAKYITVRFNNGGKIRVTKDHKIYTIDRGYVEAGDLLEGDRLQGIQRYRRGAKYCGVKLSSQPMSECKMEHRLIYEGVYGCIPGDFDIHHVDGDTYHNSINNLECLHRSTHATVTRLGCDNNHQVQEESTGRFVSTGRSPKDIIPLPESMKSRHPTTGLRVLKVGEESEAEYPVYDITVEDTHCLVADGIVAHNCGEAILRDSGGLCNLTEVVVRSGDTLAVLRNKVRYATILGTLQSTLSDFRYLRKIWRDNQEEERLLGISLTGIMDHSVLSGRVQWSNVTKLYVKGEDSLIDTLTILKQVAKETNEEWAKILGINSSKQLTLVKPSGTVSQLCGTASGIHPRFAPYYLRRVTQDNKDPLTDLMIAEGVPHVVKGEKTVFSFPIESPEGAVCAREIGAIHQLNLWKTYRDYWCEGNPSQTIYYTDDEFLDVQAWVWKNWDSIGGLSFFPLDDCVYDIEIQPYLEISKREYEKKIEEFPSSIHWESLVNYEKEDGTTSSQEYACSGGSCDIL